MSSIPAIRSVDSLLESIASGRTPKFLFFWGHAPSRDGSVTKSCFSQWWESPFEVEGVRYATAEHFMMAGKARLFGDGESLVRILESKHPKQAKDLGRHVAGFDEKVWLGHRFDLVVTGNEAKFRQNARLAEVLRNTGERILVEASPVDRIWGIGLAGNDPQVESPQHWRGLNLLGFALMEVRGRLAMQPESTEPFIDP